MIRRLMVLLFPLCILYFLVGAILMWSSVITKDVYLSAAGIVGGVASVFGLLSFLRPALSRTDLQNLEVQSLHTLAKVANEVKILEDERSKQASAISDLEKQKREMELLVRKASMALFLREQFDHHQRGILDHLKSHPNLASSLSEIASVKKKLDTLEEEYRGRRECRHSEIRSFEFQNNAQWHRHADRERPLTNLEIHASDCQSVRDSHQSRIQRQLEDIETAR